jgi:hypothetical protein
MTEPLHSNNLVPFKKRRNGYHLPGGTGEEEEHLIDLVDPNLSPEEQGFVRHYLAYADVFLQNAKEKAWLQNGHGHATSARGQEDTEDKAA